jgi:hypothetical protein
MRARFGMAREAGDQVWYGDTCDSARMRKGLVALLMLTAACHQTSEHSVQPDATPDAPPACTCDSSEYCSQTSVGVVPGPATGCIMLPTACAATPTCACLLANVTCSAGGGPTCTDDDSQLVFTCAYP